MKLVYKAATSDGKIQKGIIEARDVKDAVGYLRAHRLIPISVAQQKDNSVGKYIPFLAKVHHSELVFFTRQLASMLEAGLTLIESLRILEEQIQNETFKEIINNIVVDIEGGSSFSIAIAKYPDIFYPIYISLIKAAESSGLLDKVLSRLAETLEKQEKLKSTIKSALLYPIIVVIGMVLVMVVMMLFVIPQLSTVYESLNVDLPLPTLIIIGVSNFMINFWPIFIGMVILIGFVFQRWHKTSTGKLIIDDVVLRIPIFGKVIRLSILTEITRTLSLLIGSGTLVVNALYQVSKVSDNMLYENALTDIANKVEKGIPLTDAVGAYSLFPPILIQMVRVGEESGKLDDTFLRVSEYFEREVDTAVKNLTTALEPIIMVVLGAGVAFLIISIITPIYNITNSF